MPSLSKELLVQRMVKRSPYLAAGLAAVAVGSETAHASAAQPSGGAPITAPATGGAPIEAKPAPKLSAAQQIKRRIVEGKVVHTDPYFDAEWSFPHSKNGNFTSLPIIAKDRGVTRLFAVVQAGGHTLKSLIVLELPFEYRAVESQFDPYLNCGATPSEWGVVKIDTDANSPMHNQAVTEIDYSNGKKVLALVGSTQFDVKPSTTPAIGPPGYCATYPPGSGPVDQPSTGGAPLIRP